MRHVVEIPAADVVPERGAVLAALRIPVAADAGRTRELLDGAIAAFTSRAEARAVVQRIGADTFTRVYRGQGRNEQETPVTEVSPRAEDRALFVLTLGQALSDAIAGHFSGRELAEATMLDAVASEGADLAVGRVGAHYLVAARELGAVSADAAVVPYSPGYCGWHISGQQALFEVVDPREIEVSVNSSHLMLPLKSVSGVLLAATPEAHEFDDAFEFCDRCTSRGCRERLAAIGEEPPWRS